MCCKTDCKRICMPMLRETPRHSHQKTTKIACNDNQPREHVVSQIVEDSALKNPYKEAKEKLRENPL
jgi:hypothetical protein